MANPEVPRTVVDLPGLGKWVFRGMGDGSVYMRPLASGGNGEVPSPPRTPLLVLRIYAPDEQGSLTAAIGYITEGQRLPGGWDTRAGPPPVYGDVPPVVVRHADPLPTCTVASSNPSASTRMDGNGA